MRMLVKSWKDKRNSFTRRARWFAASSRDIGEDMRICLEDPDGAMNHFPVDREHAEGLWGMFKSGAINHRGESNG